MPTFDPAGGIGTPMPEDGRSVRREVVQQDFKRWVEHEREPGSRHVAEAESGASTPTGGDPGDGRQAALAVDDAVETGVLYGWLSSAHYGLSHLARRPGEAAVPDASPSTSNDQAGKDAVPGEPTAGIAAVAVGRDPGAARNDGPPIHRSAGQPPHGAAAGRTKASPHAELPLAAMWPDRSLRRVTGADGEVTVWLRDYRLDAGQVASAVDEILSAQETMPPASRIMVNGVEVWRQDIPRKPERT